MKKLFALFLFAVVLLTCAVAEPAEKSLLPFAEVYWSDTRDSLAQRLDINLDGMPEGSIVSSTDLSGLTLAVVYNFSDTLDTIIVFTDAVGDEQYKATCADLYAALLATLASHTGMEATTADSWSSSVAQSLYGENEVSLAMWNGDLTRKAFFETEQAKYSTMFSLSDNTLNIGYIVEKPATEEAASKHFDLSPFSGDAYDITIDDIEGQAFIGSTYSRADVFSFEHTDQSDYYYSVIYPDVYIGDYQASSEFSLFRIWIRYNAEEWLFADNAIIKCGDKRFTASNIDVSTDVLDHGTVKMVGETNEVCDAYEMGRC